MREMDVVQRPGLPVPGQRRPGVASELKAAVGVVEEAVLPVEQLVTEVCHCHQKECRCYPPRESHILTGPDVLDSDAGGREEPLDLAAPGLVLLEHPLSRVPDGLLGAGQVRH